MGKRIGGGKWGSGNRHDSEAQVMAVARLEPEEMRAYLLTHPLSRGGRLWCDRVLEGVDAGERTAMRLFGDAMRWTGAQMNIAAVFVERLGVGSESELMSLVDKGRRLKRIQEAGKASLDVYRDEAVELLKLVLREKPEWRTQVLEALMLDVQDAQERPQLAPGSHNGGGEVLGVKP